MFRTGCLLACMAALAAACSRPPGDSAKPEALPPPPAGEAAGRGVASVLTVVGRSPAASGGFPSIIVLEPHAPGDPPSQAVVPYMDQVQQSFIPSILLVRTGQPTEFRNNDDVLHNVRVREDATHSPAFNVAIPTGEKYLFTFARDGFYDVGCDIHPGMSAQIVATSNPYVTLADQQGNFVIDNVPTGSYTAVLYAGAEKIDRPVDLAPDKSELNLTIK